MSNVLLMPFINESADYTLGFEAGEILENYLFHTANIEQVHLICSTFGIKADITKGDDWSTMNIGTVLSS